jgi:hypothetical protein
VLGHHAKGGTEMKALTIKQPGASLFALRVRWIETRSWSTRYRGLLVIHAARVGASLEQAPEAWGALGATAGVDAYEAWHNAAAGESYFDPSLPQWPFGAVVATATLVDVVPMVAWSPLTGPAVWAAHMIPMAGSDAPRMLLLRDAATAAEALASDGPIPADIDATDQLPYGDFRGGRWAWMLSDIKATTERCPACWGTGCTVSAWRSDPEIGRESTRYVGSGRGDMEWCPICRRSGVCEPIPARGRQGLWEWAA